MLGKGRTKVRPYIAMLDPLCCECCLRGMPTPDGISQNAATLRRQTERLHWGRVSAPGARYFLTFVTQGRMPWLATVAHRDVMREVLCEWQAEEDGSLLAATIMPDHVHALIELGDRLSVGRLVARWKAQAVRRCCHAGAWQRDFWEHRLRPEETTEEYGLYLFLNPYRAGLIPAAQNWEGWCCPRLAAFRFTCMLEENGTPPREWLEWPEERFAQLGTGET